MIALLHTYLDDKGKADRAKAYLRRRNILSQRETIKRGHHRFTMHVPGKFSEAAAKKIFAEALAFAGVDVYEPPVYTPGAPALPDLGELAQAAEPSNEYHVDPSRGVKGYPFAVCAPYRDGLPGTAVLGCFAYRPHAEIALRAIEAAG